MPDWVDILEDVNQLDAQLRSQSPVDIVRRKHLKNLYQSTERNVIAYYSGWLSKPGVEGTQITDEDKNGFMMAIHQLDRTVGLDLILHTPGGELNATETIINYLQKMFKGDIRVIVPQIAMSGGTLIACASKEIIMGVHSNLGPIDPQVMGVPAHGVIEEFNAAAKDIKNNPGNSQVWYPILSKYHPTFLSQCKNAIEHSEEIARRVLQENMFQDDDKREKIAENIVNYLTDYGSNKSHSRHIHIEECKKIGLKILELEKNQDLQNLVLSLHHAFMYSFMNTQAFKIIENHRGRAFIKITGA